MKKYLMIILVLVGFMGCNLTDNMQDAYLSSHLGIELSENTPLLTDYFEIMTFLHDNMTYKKDTFDHWQSYDESMFLGTGDCEDFAFAFMNILYNSTGKKGELGGINSQDALWYLSREIATGGRATHGIVILENLNVDPTSNAMVKAPICYYYAFDDVFTIYL